MGMGKTKREMIAARAAKELHTGMIVNLGIGMPTMIPNFIAPDVRVVFHGENGLLGYGKTPQAGQEDPHLCNAGGLPVTAVAETSYFDSTVAFGIIRRGCVDITFLGALQVSEAGDLANWIVPGKVVPGMGGAMELAQKSRKVVVLSEHCTRDGSPKILRHCTLPLTAQAAVDLIITEKAVIEVTPTGLLLTEIHADCSIEEVQQCTEPPLRISDSLVRFS